MQQYVRMVCAHRWVQFVINLIDFVLLGSLTTGKGNRWVLNLPSLSNVLITVLRKVSS